MDIIDEPLGNDVYRIRLSGRMDIEGVGQIETRLAGMTAAPRMAIVVDMSDVPFMSSIGIRALVMNAKAVARRGGRMALLQPEANVRSVLSSMAIDRLIPVCDTLDDALVQVTG